MYGIIEWHIAPINQHQYQQTISVQLETYLTGFLSPIFEQASRLSRFFQSFHINREVAENVNECILRLLDKIVEYIITGSHM